jgi:DNA-binding NarL/FixJ family response regulator
MMSRREDLSEREEEVFLLYCRLGGKEAGSRCGISENTVKFHVKRVYHKLNVTNQIDAMVTLGWLRFPDLSNRVISIQECRATLSRLAT